MKSINGPSRGLPTVSYALVADALPGGRGSVEVPIFQSTRTLNGLVEDQWAESKGTGTDLALTRQRKPAWARKKRAAKAKPTPAN